MSRLNIVLIWLIIVLLAYFGTLHRSFASQPTPVEVKPTQIPTPTPTPRLPEPSFFSIPKIGVHAPIEPVGTDEQGTMLLPQALDRVGWFMHGFRPGERGNAVIAGHLDSATGAGAIFYNLWMLEPGDEMDIVDITGYTYKYIVTQKVTYPYDQVPVKELFAPSERKILNLITCTGTWDAFNHNYSHRMVVTAELKEDLP